MILLFNLSAVNAQRSGAVFFPLQNQTVGGSDLRDITDTIMPLSFIPASEGGLGCFTGIYSSPDSGYVTGNNQYGDLEKAQFFALSQMGYADSGSLQSVLVKFSYKTQNAYPENVVVKIYSADTSGNIPANVIATSESVNLSSINTDGGYTQFIFTTPVTVSDSFFASVQLPVSTGDTLVILSTQDNCVGNSGWSWELWNDFTWHTISDSWVLNLDLAIFPVISFPDISGVNEIDNNTLQLFPNPADDLCTLFLPGFNSDHFSISIFDQSRKLINQQVTPYSSSSIKLNCSELEAGIYIIQAQSFRQIATAKLIVLRQ
ncbi:MAG: T9SS type A sorting domain-containing protein [Chitinophagales bacterium]